MRLTARLDEAASHVAPPVAAGMFVHLRRLAAPVAVAAMAVAAMILGWTRGVPESFAELSEIAAIDGSALPIPTLTPGATWTVTTTELCAAVARERQEVPAPSVMRCSAATG